MTAVTNVEIGEGRAAWGSRPTPPEQPCDCVVQRQVQMSVQPMVQSVHRAAAASTAMAVISVVGARGGSGASTIAAVLALVAQRLMRTELVTPEPDHLRDLLGMPRAGAVLDVERSRLSIVTEASGLADVVIIDAGTVATRSRSSGPANHRTLGVLRGPCYSALMAMVGDSEGIDGLVMLCEPGRALTVRDARDVLGIDVVASVPVTPRVARAIDAGLLERRHPHLREFRELERWLIGQLDPFPARSVSAPSSAPNEVRPTGTDMLGAQSAPSASLLRSCAEGCTSSRIATLPRSIPSLEPAWERRTILC